MDLYTIVTVGWFGLILFHHLLDFDFPATTTVLCLIDTSRIRIPDEDNF